MEKCSQFGLSQKRTIIENAYQQEKIFIKKKVNTKLYKLAYARFVGYSLLGK